MLESFAFFPLDFVVKKGGLSPNEHDLSAWPVFIHGKNIYVLYYTVLLLYLLYIYILCIYGSTPESVGLSNQVKNRKIETIVASSLLAETEALMMESV